MENLAAHLNWKVHCVHGNSRMFIVRLVHHMAQTGWFCNMTKFSWMSHESQCDCGDIAIAKVNVHQLSDLAQLIGFTNWQAVWNQMDVRSLIFRWCNPLWTWCNSTMCVVVLTVQICADQQTHKKQQRASKSWSTFFLTNSFEKNAQPIIKKCQWEDSLSGGTMPFRHDETKKCVGWFWVVQIAPR